MKDKLIAAIVALGVYLLLLFCVFYYFGYRSSPTRSTHYVAKNAKAISVNIGSTPKKASGKQKNSPKKKKPKKTQPKKHKNAPKSAKAPKKVPKRTKSEVRKKPSIPKKSHKKRVDTGKLFSNVKTINKKDHPQESADSAKKGEKSIKKSTQKGDKGTENRYFAHIEELLKGWPAQVNFAGEEIDVWFKVYNSGKFEFKVKKLSNNTEFNDALISYLKQLQSIGFGSHNNSRPYEIEVSFIAHE